MRSLQIEIMPPAALRPYLRNARIHPKRQIKKIAESIRQIGFVNPILIDEHEEIIAGHGRLMAANLLGLDAIPVIRIRDLSEAQKRALRIADNKLALDSTWSSELLAEELEELAGLDFDLTLTVSTAEQNQANGRSKTRPRFACV
ncbi:ParB/Srx family N-terminal domain-containing protein [Mesorhizobium sp. A556]